MTSTVKAVRQDAVAQTLGVVVRRAIEEIAELRATGAEPADLARALEAVIRDRWPKGRVEAWHLLCEECVDTGWRIYTCDGDASCGRPKTHSWHRYAVACWCAKGRTFIRKPRAATDELVAVGKVSKPTRFGR